MISFLIESSIMHLIINTDIYTVCPWLASVEYITRCVVYELKVGIHKGFKASITSS